MFQLETAKIQQKSISEYLLSMEPVIPAPGAIDVISVPFESYINRIMVNNGQMVSKGDPLLEIHPSQNTDLSFLEIESAYDTAKQSLQHVKELLDLQLATNEQYLTAELNFQQAKLRLENIKKQGIEGLRNLIANVDGLIKSVNVQQGSIVPPSASLVEIIAENRFEINLGIEVEDLHKLEIGQNVILTPVYDSSSLKVVGKIRKLAHAGRILHHDL